MNDNYFIHFGCWNNGGCPKDNDLTKVLSNIKSLDNKPSFLTICGDNYYPKVKKIKTEGKQKDIKKKYLISDDLSSGFKCLPEDIPIYMTYGNHDYETDLYINDIETENNCTLTKQEINIVTNEFPNISLKLFQSAQFNRNTFILFIDTTIYDNDDIDEYIKCYESVDSQYKEIENVKNTQLEFINDFVSKVKTNNEIKNIIIIGHHPLAQFKIKKETMRYMILSNELNNILYNNIFNELNSREIKYYYLCADLHQYQSGNIKINNDMNIRQYIVGTAGAKKDEVNKDMLFKEPQIQENVEYYMNEDDINSATDKNGYLNCIDEGREVRFEFIPIESIGGKRKTMRRRRNRRTMKNKRKTMRKSRNNKRKRN